MFFPRMEFGPDRMLGGINGNFTVWFIALNAK